MMGSTKMLITVKLFVLTCGMVLAASTSPELLHTEANCQHNVEEGQWICPNGPQASVQPLAMFYMQQKGSSVDLPNMVINIRCLAKEMNDENRQPFEYGWLTADSTLTEHMTLFKSEMDEVSAPEYFESNYSLSEVLLDKENSLFNSIRWTSAKDGKTEDTPLRLLVLAEHPRDPRESLRHLPSDDVERLNQTLDSRNIYLCIMGLGGVSGDDAVKRGTRWLYTDEEDSAYKTLLSCVTALQCPITTTTASAAPPLGSGVHLVSYIGIACVLGGTALCGIGAVRHFSRKSEVSKSGGYISAAGPIDASDSSFLQASLDIGAKQGTRTRSPSTCRLTA